MTDRYVIESALEADFNNFEDAVIHEALLAGLPAHYTNLFTPSSKDGNSGDNSG